MTPEQQALNNLLQMAHAFVDAQVSILQNAIGCAPEAAEATQPDKPVIVEGDGNFA